MTIKPLESIKTGKKVFVVNSKSPQNNDIDEDPLLIMSKQNIVKEPTYFKFVNKKKARINGFTVENSSSKEKLKDNSSKERIVKPSKINSIKMKDYSFTIKATKPSQPSKNKFNALLNVSKT